MEKCTLHLGTPYMFLKVSVCGSVIAYLDYITNLEILPYLLHFSEVLKTILIIKYFVGYVCNRLLQLNAAIVRELTCCKILARHWASRKYGLQIPPVSSQWPIPCYYKNVFSAYVLTADKYDLVDIKATNCIDFFCHIDVFLGKIENLLIFPQRVY